MGEQGNRQRQATEFPCPTCPFRAGSFCGAVIERTLERMPPDGAVPWKVHDGSPANRMLQQKNRPSEDVFVLCLGLAIRFIQLSDGRRQILSTITPGELFSVAQVFRDTNHFSVMSLTEVRYTRFRRTTIRELVGADPEILDNLARNGIAELQEKDALSVDLGRRRAEERIAHLILRLLDRLSSHAIEENAPYAFPLRQQQIADMTGLTPVHVSRVISEFRRSGIVDVSHGRLTILSRTKLEALGRPS